MDNQSDREETCTTASLVSTASSSCSTSAGVPTTTTGEIDTDLRLTRPRQQTQANLCNFVVSNKPVSLNRSKQLDIQLVRLIVKEYQPFSVVDDPKFRKFVQMLCPGYKLPSRKTVSNSLIPQAYNKTKDEVNKKIDDAFAVCVTTDSWTSVNTSNFTAITVHWLNEETKLCSCLLDCVEYNERHTAENLAKLFQEKFEEWGIQNKISAIVTDNAANVVAAVRHGKWGHLACFAHTINLVVQNGLKEINGSLFKFRRVVEFFKRSSNALAKLNQTQEQMTLPILKLKIDVCTRWNSTWDMLSRLLERKDAILATLAILDRSKYFDLTAKDWEIAEIAVNVLRIFYDVTNEVSAEKHITISKQILLVDAIEGHLRTFVPRFEGRTDVEEIKKMTLTFQKEIVNRFRSADDKPKTNLQRNELVSQATLLDPRFKKFGFIDSDRAKEAYNALQVMASSIKIQGDNDGGGETAKVQQKSENSLLWKAFDAKVEHTKASANPTSASIVELDKYFGEPLIDRHDDPLVWWHQRKNVYPRLYQLVKKRLCLMATSVPCERIFSKSGQIISDKRSRLKSTKASQVIFLNANMT